MINRSALNMNNFTRTRSTYCTQCKLPKTVTRYFTCAHFVKYKSHLAAFDRIFLLSFIEFSFLNDQSIFNPQNVFNGGDLMHLQQMFHSKYVD